MVKKIILTILGSAMIGLTLLSFIDVYKEPETEKVNSFTYALGDINNNLKNINNLSMRESDLITATSRGLALKNNEGKLEYDLAEDVVVKDNGLHYEFKLKEDIKWSDGNLITSEDIISFFKEIILNEDEESIEGILNIYGAREYRDSKGLDDTKLAMLKLDNSVVIRLNKVDKNFIEELTKPVYRLRKDLNLWEDLKSNHQMIICSGDYTIEDVKDEEIILEKSIYAKGEGPKEINIVRNMSEEISMAKFETGEVDIVVNPPSKQLNRLYSEGKLKTFPAKTGKYIYMNPNNEKQDLNTRKLIYRTLIEAVSSYYKENEHFIEMAEYSYFLEDKNNLNNIQNRKVITTKAIGELPEVITIMALDNQANRNLCMFIQNWFKENTKTSLRYTLVKESEYKNLALRDRYNITLIDMELIANNREEVFGSIEYWYTEDEKKIFEKEKNNDSNFKELENILFNNYQIVPLYFENKNVAISQKIKDIYFDYYGNIQFTLK